MAKKRVPELDKFEWQQSVKEIRSLPPLSPSKGDRYLINDPESGTDWVSFHNYITYYNGSDWVFVDPKEGMHLWIKDENRRYVYYNSEWKEDEVAEISVHGNDYHDPNFTEEAPIDGKLYGRKNADWSAIDVGLFEIDVNGGLMPITEVRPDNHYELDTNNDIMPKE